MRGEPTSPDSADILLTPPALGGPWARYDVEVCPTAGPSSACIQKRCPAVAAPATTTTCSFGDSQTPALTQQTEYTATAVAVQQDGTTTSLPGSDSFTTPSFS